MPENSAGIVQTSRTQPQHSKPGGHSRCGAGPLQRSLRHHLSSWHGRCLLDPGFGGHNRGFRC
ncbi:Protein of unknown function [Pyronema omphalodes CBS 100304]|uniref:Uncharacterized protein n=1 Tax=Pyronema omphalodes (strain CBS 100304) TaxID=1076935 RepID=U4LHK7_PYROM|nr:Protein of unknown function [Pyronema omphalodes CBS 100304]